MNKHRIRKTVIAVILIILAAAGLVRFSLEPADYYDTLRTLVAQGERALSSAETGNAPGQYAPLRVQAFSAEVTSAREILSGRTMDYDRLKDYCKQFKRTIQSFRSAGNTDCLSLEDVAELKQTGRTFTKNLPCTFGTVSLTLHGSGIETPAPVHWSVEDPCRENALWQLFKEKLGVGGVALTFLHGGTFPAAIQVEVALSPSANEMRVYRLDPEKGSLGSLIRAERAGDTVTFPLQEGGTYFLLDCGLTQELRISPEEALAQSLTQLGLEQNAQTQKATCTLEIRCDTVADTSKLTNPGIAPYIPGDGTILAPLQCEIREGETVFELLRRVTRSQGIQMEFREDALYSGAYIEGINHLYEFDAGSGSGWMYKVNGRFPNYGCGQYKIQDGDVIVWCYTCNIGKDVGDQYYDSHPDANPEYN